MKSQYCYTLVIQEKDQNKRIEIAPTRGQARALLLQHLNDFRTEVGTLKRNNIRIQLSHRNSVFRREAEIKSRRKRITKEDLGALLDNDSFLLRAMDGHTLLGAIQVEIRRCPEPVMVAQNRIRKEVC